MDDFLNYFEDEKFVRWVYSSDSELDLYWDVRFKEHPEEKETALQAKKILLQLRPAKEKENPEEAIHIYSKIIQEINNEKKHHSWMKIFLPLMRYAAVAVFFLSLGVFIHYQMGKQTFKFDSDIAINNNTEAQLMLADGQKIAIKTKESMVEYKSDGKIVINEKDTINNQASAKESEMNQLIVPYGKHSSIRLPDETMAYLNAGSRLIYPSAFSGKKREVFLLGEGYFEVSHNPQKPFIVKTNDISVIALGTVFNVSAYPADKTIETVLVNGNVVIRDNSFHIFDKELVLKPNEMASFNRETLETTKQLTNTDEYVAWHQGYLDFQSTDLNRVILKVERYYNIKILLNNPMLGSRRISGKLVLKDDQEKVLEALASTARVELFKINESAYGLK